MAGKTVRERVRLRDLENCTFVDVDFSANERDHMVNATNLRNCKFVKCKFHGKSTVGVAMNMTGPNTKNNLFSECEWYDLSYSSGNGGEPLRLGNSQHSGIKFDCIVRNCYFHDLKADTETISIKTCGNLVEGCRHENNNSSIVVRHGGLATIRGNRFKGTGGIRVYGYGNIIENNHFEGNQSTKWPPIILGYANAQKDPNWTSVSQPSNREGRSHALYAQINANRIVNNIYKDCKVTVRKQSGRPLGPINSKIETDSGVPLPPPPPPPPPDEEEPVVILPPEEPPTDVEGEPISPDEPTAYLCSACGVEEAKNKLSLLLCPRDAEVARPRLQQLLLELKKQVNRAVDE